MSVLRNITIGQYFPGNSVVHRLDPRSKLLLAFGFIIALFAVKSGAAYLVLGIATLAVILVSTVPLRMIIRGLRPILIIVSLTIILHVFTTREGVLWLQLGFIRIYSGGVLTGLMLAFRLVLLVMATSIMTLTTSPIALTDGIESLLKPFKRIGVPAHELAMMMTIALRFIPTLIEEAEKIMKAQLARGADFESGGLIRRAKALLPLLIPLFISAFRRADELAMAMEARCYRGGDSRTKFRILKYTTLDLMGAAVFFIVVAAAALVARLF